ncbi:hypothetical protein [Dyella sp.]|uniref:hypothetical protein n=1 Tax=Dyella sp. TaxID=1869338 RepID=UPI002ED4B110
MLAWAGSSVAEESRFRFTQAPGPFHVGFKVVEQYDRTRDFAPATDDLGKSWQQERARPIQTLIWYPSTQASGKPMTVGDYQALAATETSFGIPIHSASFTKWEDRLKPTQAERLWAIRDTPMAKGRFPVVVYAPGDTDSGWDNADLCEYLASQGYVVLASASVGPHTRDMTDDLAGIHAQARDVAFLVAFAGTLPNADTSRLAMVGWSWGALAQLFVAAGDIHVDALVALDGSPRYWPGLVKDGGVDAAAMTTPLLFFTQGDISIERLSEGLITQLAKGPNVLNAWTHGDLLTVHMLGMTHPEFSSMNQRRVEWSYFSEDRKADYDREDGTAYYAWMTRYTARFLDTYLKHDAQAMAFLKRSPRDNGVPVHFIDANFRAAHGVAASIDGLRAELGRRGFEHAADVLDAIRADDPTFSPDEDAMDAWASRLLGTGHEAQAKAVLELDVQAHPTSSHAHESLGEGYRRIGEEAKARQAFMKALELDPANADAREQLHATPR